MARLDISFAVSNLPTQINACNISARTLAEGPTRPKYSSNHIIMLHCYSNAAINKKEVYLHHIPRDIQVAGRHLDKPHSTTNLPHWETDCSSVSIHNTGTTTILFFCVDSKCTPRNYDHNDKNQKNMNTERQMIIELKIMLNEDNTRRIILQPHKFIFFP